jgi:hypothetical protein
VERVVLCIVNIFNEVTEVNIAWCFVLLHNCVGSVLPKRSASGRSPRTVCVLCSFCIVIKLASW